jgi:hypothetical protein
VSQMLQGHGEKKDLDLSYLVGGYVMCRNEKSRLY